MVLGVCVLRFAFFAVSLLLMAALFVSAFLYPGLLLVRASSCLYLDKKNVPMLYNIYLFVDPYQGVGDRKTSVTRHGGKTNNKHKLDKNYTNQDSIYLTSPSRGREHNTAKDERQRRGNREPKTRARGRALFHLQAGERVSRSSD